MNKLKIENVFHTYDGKNILEDINIDVSEGEVVSLLGPSGCGKSTILRLTAGLEPLSSGKISLVGKLVSGVSKFVFPENRAIGLVFQNPSLFPHMSVLDNVMFGIKTGDNKSKKKLAIERLGAVRMATSAVKFPHEISGGEQQRVALARALAISPKIMLLDEPFANLDSVLRKEIREETLSLLKSLGIATLLVTHDPEEALRMSDRIYVMQKGRIVQSGTPNDLYLRPKNTFVARFFGELNLIDGIVKDKKAKTVLGDIPVGVLPDGTNARIFMRPEALSIGLKKKKNSIAATVIDIRFLGLTSTVYLKVKGREDALRARMLGTSLPAKGKKVYVTLNMDHVFTFSVTDEMVS